MRRALLIAFHYPPAAAIGGRRAVRFARHLPANGYEVAVLAADPKLTAGLEIDDALVADAPAGTRVFHAPCPDLVKALSARMAAMGWRRRDARSGGERYLVATASAREKQQGTGNREQGTGNNGVMQALKDIASDLLRTPDQSAGWLGPARAAARKAVREFRPDVVIATGPPWTSLVLGALVAEEAGVPFVADLRDPWVGNPYSQPVTRLGRALAPVIERWCLRRAALIVANTGPLRDHLLARYPGAGDRIVAIPNGPDDEATPSAANDPAPAGYGGVPGQGPLKVVHTGTLYGGRDPRPIIEAIRSLRQRGAIGLDDLVLDLVGPCSIDGLDADAVARDLDGAVVFTPPVPRPEAIRLARAADVLLLFQPGAPLQLPAKVFEYLGAGREVLTVADDPGATSAFARDAGLGPIAAPQDVPAIARALLDLVERKRAGTLRRPAAESVARYRPERLVGELAAHIDRIVLARRAVAA